MALRWYSSVNFVFCVRRKGSAGSTGRLFSFKCPFYCHGIFVNGGDLFFSYFPRGWAM